MGGLMDGWMMMLTGCWLWMGTLETDVLLEYTFSS